MIIYKITNRINGKIYIGQTTYTLRSRWSQHCHPNSTCLALKRAIKKYGPDAFSVEVIAEYTTLEDLNNAEEYFIDYYNCLAPNGYNLQGGGFRHTCSEETRRRRSQAQKGRKHTPETLLKMSKAQSGQNHPMFGKKHTAETKKKLSLAGKGKQKGEKHPMFGKHHTEDAKRRISQALKGKPKPRKPKAA